MLEVGLFCQKFPITLKTVVYPLYMACLDLDQAVMRMSNYINQGQEFCFTKCLQFVMSIFIIKSTYFKSHIQKSCLSGEFVVFYSLEPQRYLVIQYMNHLCNFYFIMKIAKMILHGFYKCIKYSYFLYVAIVFICNYCLMCA